MHSDKATPMDTRVSIPRFVITQQFSLSKTLQTLGMTSAFSDSADFSGMNGTRELMLSDVVHKAYVDVNEEGPKPQRQQLRVTQN